MKTLFAAIVTIAALVVAVPAKAQFNIYDTTTAALLSEAPYISATTTNDAVAINGYVGKAVLTVAVAPRFILTTGTNTVTIQDSANGTTGWTNITGLSYAFWTNSVQTFGIEPGAQKKYVRAIHTVAGTNDFGASVVLLGRLKYN